MSADKPTELTPRWLRDFDRLLTGGIWAQVDMRFSYDEENQLIAQSDAMGFITRTAYDAPGQVVDLVGEQRVLLLSGDEERGMAVAFADAVEAGFDVELVGHAAQLAAQDVADAVLIPQQRQVLRPDLFGAAQFAHRRLIQRLELRRLVQGFKQEEIDLFADPRVG